MVEARRGGGGDGRGDVVAAGGVDDDAPLPLEWAGVERPFTDDEVATLDRVLGLERATGPTLVAVAAGVSAPDTSPGGMPEATPEVRA